jgi:hypothetical protein
MKLWQLLACIAIVPCVVIAFAPLTGFYEGTNATGKITVDNRIVKNNTITRVYINDPQNGSAIAQMEVEDELLKGIWNSGELRSVALANQGKICNVTGVGRRVPFMSWYPNVIEISCNQ